MLLPVASAQSLNVPVSAPGVPDAVFTSYEVAQVHPLDVTPDGTKLLAVNTANGTLEVFSISGAGLTLASVVKVGLEPVTVRAASNTEAWVVNEMSDSVSIIDLKSHVLAATLQTDDEPADVVFAGSPRRAYVSVAQARELMVFDPVTPTAAIARIPILGQQPRALATSVDGTKVYLGIFESGNGTTALTGGKNDPPYEVDIARSTAGPYAGVSPFPDTANGNLYASLYGSGSGAFAPPPVSVIVRRQANTAGGLPAWLDENGRNWSPFINGNLAQLGSLADRVPDWDLIDRDVAIIDTATGRVTYQAGPLNIVMGLAVNPASGAITTVGTDATNQIRYQPVLEGKFTRVLMGAFTPGTGAASTSVDLNPHLTYRTSSIPATCTPANPKVCRQNSIGDPRGIAWNPGGTKAYVTGMGSNNVIVLNAAGARAGVSSLPIPVGQGPTGIVLQSALGLAYVLNRFDATVSVINLSTETEVTRVALSYDPTPADIRAGRPVLYATQLHSGLGQSACASCHVDAKTDRLAWDLGDPTAALETASGPNVTILNEITHPGTLTPVPGTVTNHPMKGPMLTMTLVDRMQSPFLHWRGDRANLAAFAPSFQTLLGGDAPATTAQIQALQAFLATLRVPPNPYRTLTNAYPTEIAVPGPRGFPYRTGNAVIGSEEFVQQNCNRCHVGQTGRGAPFVATVFGIQQFRNPPSWQNFYRRDGLWFNDATASTAGFGFVQDGTFDSTQNSSRDDDMMAFMYSFNGSFPATPNGLNATNVSNDSHAAVGKQVTLSGSVIVDPLLPQLLALADAQAVGVVASGCISNERRGFVYARPGVFDADRAGESYTLAQMKAFAAAGSPITFTAVREGTQTRIGIDANDDGVLDGAQGVTPLRECTSGTVKNLLVNGSFESDSAPAGGWAQKVIPGWTGSSGVVEVWNALDGYPAADGQSFVEIDVVGELDTTSQKIATTAGDALVLRFWYSARPGVAADSNKFNVVWNGTVIDTLAPNGIGLAAPSWQSATYVVRATGSDTLAFTESGIYTDGVGGLLDAVSLVDMGASVTVTVTPPANLAYGKTATASSAGFGTSPAWAVDGNIDGNYADKSVSISAGDAEDWWEVDLGSQNVIQTVNLFNRTDCCSTRLNNFYVLISAAPMDGQSLPQLLANPAVTRRYVANTGFVAGNSPQEFSVAAGSVQGRYVRIAMAGTNYLQLAEVQVMGWPVGAR